MTTEQKKMSKALNDVNAERKRQTEVEGLTLEHDDEHADGMLASAGACYALHASGWALMLNADLHKYWPWGAEWWKPKNPRRDLVRAAALIIAEIERIDRAEAAKEPQP